MRTLWAWVVTKFWWLWSANLLLAILVFCAFLMGWNHETITAPNLPAWCLILAVVPAIVLGSLWLRLKRRWNLAVLSLLLIPLPAVLCVAGSFLFGILYLVIGLIGHLLGRGRVN